MRKADAYPEISKKNSKDKSLEFRLQVDHAKFKKATQTEANRMILEALGRSVGLMRSKKYITEDADIAFLESVLQEVKKEV